MNPTRTSPGASRRTLHADVVIVGARCAGSATAMLLADRGHDVLVVDRASFPSDTLSTHCIVRSGMVQLRRWGVLPALLVSGAPPLTTVEFHTADGVTAKALKDRHGVDYLLAPRRIILDDILQRAAQRAGARLQTGVGVEDVLRDATGRVVGLSARDASGPLTIRARVVVGADGLGSRVARSVGAPLTVVRPAPGSAQYTYVRADWQALEQHLGDAGFAGVFPTHGGEACIWVCAPVATVREHRMRRPTDAAFLALLGEISPTLAERVRAGEQTAPVRGMLRMPNQFRQAAGPGWALVGDAGYHRDAITALGISDAFRDAELLASALDEALRDPTREASALAAYGRDRDQMAAEQFDLTVRLAAFPARDEFVELQRRLSCAVDDQAAVLSAIPFRVAAPAA